MNAPSVQLWVKDKANKVYGPLSPASIELLFANKILKGPVTASTDGMVFTNPGGLGGDLRQVFPKDTWGPIADAAPPAAAPPAPHAAPLPAAAPAPVPKPPSNPPEAIAKKPSPAPIALERTVEPAAKPPPAPFAQKQPAEPIPGPAVTSPVNPKPSERLFPNPPNSPHPPPRSEVHAPTPTPSYTSVFPGTGATSGMYGVATGGSPPGVHQYASLDGVSASSFPSSVFAANDSGSGELSETPMAQLYVDCARTGATTKLTVTLPLKSLTFYFKRGSLEAVESSAYLDAPAQVLLRHQVLTSEQLQRAEAARQQSGGDLLFTVFQLGIAQPNQAFERLAQRMQSLLIEAFSARSGTYTFSRGAPPPSLVVPTSNKWAFFLQAVREMPVDICLEFLAPHRSSSPRQTPGVVPFDELKFGAQEMRVYSLCDGVRTVDQLLDAAEEHVAAHCLWMLLPLKLIQFHELKHKAPQTSAPVEGNTAHPPGLRASMRRPPFQEPPKSAPQQRASPVAPKAPAEAKRPPEAPSRAPIPPPPPFFSRSTASIPMPTAVASSPTKVPSPQRSAPSRVEPDISKSNPQIKPSSVQSNDVSHLNITWGPIPDTADKLVELFERLKKMPYFDILGIAKDAPMGAVKVAYLKLAKHFHPDTVAPGTSPELVKARSDIFTMIGEAMRTLSNPAERATYLSELEANPTGESLDIMALLKSDELFHKASTLVKMRKFQEALPLLQEAVEGNPVNGEYLGWQAFAQLSSSMDLTRAARPARDQLQKALALSPESPWLNYFMSVAQKACGDMAASKAALQRCLTLDPKHSDAQRDMKILNASSSKSRTP